MIAHVIEALAVLIVPAVLPSVTALGARPITVFLIPLVGAVFAAVAAELELVIGGTILEWFVILVVSANVVSLIRQRDLIVAPRGRGRRVHAAHENHRQGLMWRWPSAWPIFTVTVIGLALLWPLQALRAPVIAYDGYGIWTLHSLFIYGGHSSFLNDLTNPAYRFSNPNYPPLVPASGALGFAVTGDSSFRLAVVITSVLNACALGAAACGIVAISEDDARVVPRLAALAAGVVVCLIGFGLSGPYGVGGYADLLWAASAVAAIIIGLLLPPSGKRLVAAWVCATVAGLSKNEGFITALVILALLAVRYIPAQSRHRPAARAERAGRGVFSSLSFWRTWALRVAFVVIAALPGIFWTMYVKYRGIGSDFVGSSSQSVSLRFHATASAVWENFHVLPLAAAVALLGALVLRPTRRRLQVGNDGWMWVVVAASLAALFITYVFGALEIHWWLSTSANRTTIFAQLALYSDMAVWLAVAASAHPVELDAGAGPPALTRRSRSPSLEAPPYAGEGVA